MTDAEDFIQALNEEAAELPAALGHARQAMQRGLPIPGVDQPAVLLAIDLALQKLAKRDTAVGEEFHLIPGATHGQLVARCPCCQKIPQLWERAGNGTAVKAVSCVSGDAFGGLNNGCPLYMPPEDFYKPTYAAAAAVWNTWATHCTAEAGMPTPVLHPTKD